MPSSRVVISLGTWRATPSAATSPVCRRPSRRAGATLRVQPLFRLLVGRGAEGNADGSKGGATHSIGSCHTVDTRRRRFADPEPALMLAGEASAASAWHVCDIRCLGTPRWSFTLHSRPELFCTLAGRWREAELRSLNSSKANDTVHERKEQWKDEPAVFATRGGGGGEGGGWGYSAHVHAGICPYVGGKLLGASVGDEEVRGDGGGGELGEGEGL
jgi:hypothetical protein